MKYIPGPYTQREVTEKSHGIEVALSNRFRTDGPITDESEKRIWREKIEEVSFGRNTVMYDDQGNPSVMVYLPAFREVDVLAGASSKLHPAFIVNGVNKPGLYLGKYQSIVTGSGAGARALSLKMQDPRASITFDNAMTACVQKGTGWHLMSRAEIAAVGLWTKKQGFAPRGNNNYGADHSVASERGIPSYMSGTSVGRVLTGSGPLSWSHDGTPFGIYDLNGNVREWVGGLRLNDGEIQIMENNNAADNTKSHASNSEHWRAILEDGTLVDPGEEGTLKYDYLAPVPGTSSYPFKIVTTIVNRPDSDTPYGVQTFQTLTTDATIPTLAKLLGLYPIDTNHGGDYIYMQNRGERLPYCGGTWNSAGSAGVWFLSLLNVRGYSYVSLGFRLAFVA